MCHPTILRSTRRLGLPTDRVFLSFDDGPNLDGSTSLELLDVLKARDVRACFCVIGDHVRVAPGHIRRVVDEGHWLVNHFATHRRPSILAADSIDTELDGCDEAIAEAVGWPGAHCTTVRPPYGLVTPALIRVIGRRGLRLMPLTSYQNDHVFGPADAETIVNRVVGRAVRDRGGIFVLHEDRFARRTIDDREHNDSRSGYNRTWVPGAVDQIIRRVREHGLEFLEPATFFGDRPAIR